MSQWEASDNWHFFFSCDVRKGHHSKARSIESIVRSKIRRNRMHADSVLFISRVAASKNHTFFNHFLCLTIKHYCESSHIFAQCPFLTSRPIFGHIWPSGGLMWTIGENIHKTAFTFSAHKKKGFNISENFFRKWILKRYGNLPKEKKLKGQGHFNVTDLLPFIFHIELIILEMWCSSNFWVCEKKSVMSPFKWKLCNNTSKLIFSWICCLILGT